MLRLVNEISGQVCIRPCKKCKPYREVAFALSVQLAARPAYSRESAGARDILEANSHGRRAFSMQDLRVIGVESGALVVVADDGTRYRIPIDEVLQSKLRQSVPDPGTGPKLSPREIQSHIRSGMSAQDVASITGASLDYVERFEGPVMAEREFVITSALAVAVRTAADTDPLAPVRSFGTAIRERLYELGAINERWASWKENPAGWVVKLSFTANQVDHDARWQFDPRKRSLAPINSDALVISQQGDASGPLIPRLRVVSEPAKDASRFDSGAFAIEESAIRGMTSPTTHRAGSADTPHSVTIGAVTQSQNVDPAPRGSQTADLLDALRRRRGERESASFEDAQGRSGHPSTGTIRIIDIPLDDFGDEYDLPHGATQPQPAARRKGRVSMPSWDEIVFGARPDDDLA